VIGFGPVGARFVDELVPALEAGLVEVTVVGAEEGDPYNRVLVAEYAVGHTSLGAMSLGGSTAAVAAGARIITGATVTAISRSRRVVTVVRGDHSEGLHYDRLIFATGARANVPTLDGIVRVRRDHLAPSPEPATLDSPGGALPVGVTTLRDLADAERVLDAVRGARRIVVLGAGVLGMEIALAASSVGAQVCVVYHGGIPMARSLDRGSGTVLARAARRAGVTMVDHTRAESIVLRLDDDGTERFDALVCADGKQISGDLLLLSCGVGARVELARLAGLDVAAGILVDDGLTSWADSRICAIGDCAQIAPRPALGDSTAPPVGAPSGLIGPGWRQAEWLAARIMAELSDGVVVPAMARERPALVVVKAEGIDVVAAGDLSADPWDAESAHTDTGGDRPRHTDAGRHDDSCRLAATQVAEWADPEHGRYVKMVTRDGVLEAFVSVGMPRTGAELTLLYERGSELPADRSVLLRYDGPDYEPSFGGDGFALESTVCWCNGVTVESVVDAATSGDRTVACVSAATRAGTGCGGCRGRIADVIEWAGAIGS
jgi:assimilatory nitrate reductase electron transfer subunit